jgi:ABC-type transport system involved in multi-copper enzyme maturation permease subunit
VSLKFDLGEAEETTTTQRARVSTTRIPAEELETDDTSTVVTDTYDRPFEWVKNPVLRKELTSRMSIRRMTKYNRLALTGFMAVVLPIVYLIIARVLFINSSVRDGRDIFAVIAVGFQMAFAVLLSITVTSGVITLEREKQTWNALLLSRLTSWEIVWGKLLGSVVPALAMQLIFIPILIMAALKGGVTLGSFIGAEVFVVFCTFFYGIIGMFFSWLCRRTQLAAASAMATVMISIVASPVLLALWQSLTTTFQSKPETFIPLWTNPFYVMLQITGIEANGTPLEPWQNIGIPVFFYLTSGFVGWLLTVVMLRRLSDGPPEMTP